MTELSAHIGEIARALLGEPNQQLSTRQQLRFGHRGSVAVDIAGPKAGSWFDHENNEGGGAWDLLTRKGGLANGAVFAWLREKGIKADDQHIKAEVVATYDYCDEHGQLLFQAVRFEPKDFRQRRPDGKGGWQWSVKGVRPVPYRLPELIAAPADAAVYIPEGEKDVESLRRLGLVATCNAGGVGKWRPDFARYLKGRQVVILPDNDDGGRDHARKVAANLRPVARSVKILDLAAHWPEMPPKGDVSDWLARGGGTREKLERLAAAAQDDLDDHPLEQAPRIELIRFEDMRPRLSGRPLVRGLLELEQTSAIVGAPGTGKTFLAIDGSLHVSAGLEWMGRRVAEGGVVYVAAEAGRSIMNRVAAWKFAHGYDEDAAIPFAAVTSQIDLCHADSGDLDLLIEAIRAANLDPLRLVVIDTVSRALAGGDENSSGDMGAFVRSLDRLRDELRCHVCAIHHIGKDATRGARGHSLLSANLDTIITVERDEAAKVSIATVSKQRDGESGGQIPFRLRSIEVGYDDDDQPVTSCVVEPSDEPRPAARKDKPLPPAQARALALLVEAINRDAQIPPANSHIPAERPCVTEATWREYCYRGGISSGDQDAKKKAFKRSAEALLVAGRIGAWDPWVWLCQ